MEQPEITLVPIRYVGGFAQWSDHLYDSGLTFAKNKTTSVPAWAARLFLKHSEFKDMRPPAKRTQLDDMRPVVEVVEDDDILIDRIPLENMTPAQLQSFTMKNFGVRLEAEAPRQQMIEEARSLVGLRRRA